MRSHESPRISLDDVRAAFYALLWLRRVALAAGSAYEVGRRLGRGDPALPPG
jgi:hypothetical protein